MRKTKEETIQTINLLLNTAKHYFTEKGYAHVSLEDIVQQAKLTRGAVYHHFKNKKGLFLAVFEDIQKEIGEEVEKEAMKSEDLWEQLLNGCRAFLNVASQPDHKRILLIDGPSVLGWDTFRMMDRKYSMNSLRELLTAMQEHKLIQVTCIDALTHTLSGAMNEAVLWIAENNESNETIEEVMKVLKALMLGVRR
ncbi:TetR/AcrR family transcriptional regulator [Virgibacillus sp. YIM 98842]|jgi:AcrR family transcriptional regulator|uniref:TetR/AcrR family transcriptional regulator n=1 Tax=Virgibacillus sp. YIM 98842 TaxID=2663533 RepID=UPI0013DA66A1|nr:TetR/AcrR family transcriptional regulator [Virgibacillus sp. YIM 98842]